MKRLLSIALVVCFATACSNSGGESGVENDGIKTVDTNGAFEESTPTTQGQPATDTAMGENRTDISTRDSASTKDSIKK